MKIYTLLLALALFGLFSLLSCSGKSSGGCTKESDCLAGEVCANGTCEEKKQSCNECTASSTRCVGTKIQTCKKLASGCTAWSAEESCPSNQTCQGTACITLKVKEGDKCTAPEACESGLLCIRTPGDANGRCARRCVKSSDCPSGLGCFPVDTGTQACARLFQPPVDAQCKVKVERATINGGCWDVGCGAPDPYVSVKVNGSSYVTTTVNDNFNPTWNETTDRTYSYPDILKTMEVALKDEDFSDHDTMVNWTYDAGRWDLSNAATGKSFKLETVDNSITLYISISCSF